MTSTITQCTAARHGASNNAWRDGCRCPDADAAHEQWKADRRSRRWQGRCPAAVAEDGTCIAPRHGTWQAFNAGCRCPEAVEAEELHRERRRAASRERALERHRAYSHEFSAESRRVRRLTGGRLDSDPRRVWRGGRMAVSRDSLFWVTRGMFTAEATMGELMVAVIRLEGAHVPDSPWRSRPMTNVELGDRLGIDNRQVYRLRQVRLRLREQRHLRRLADSRWRTAVAAAVIERGRG